ncbi:MAG: hypothetical protein VXW91_03850 [Pseudomonadota bacterium]|mgnify:CR=1 FL=1|nr:hypothetical protein [Pseudomonadota bacterium]MEC8665573.1 hypothetical protein [Pseudomonadota bacterium]
MSYTYEWPQASPCSNIILYTLKGNQLRILVTDRDQSVGIGKSLSAGGFDEVKDAFHRAGEMIDGRAETYREMHEELGEGIKEILPYDDFKRRVYYLWDGLIANAKHPLVEKVVMRAMQVTEAEMSAIMALPSTSEQVGKEIKLFTLNDDPTRPVDTQIVDHMLTGFKYPHEIEAAKMLYERLESAVKDRDLKL